MSEVDWDSRARQGVGFQSVIDPADRSGLKNGLIDRIQWDHIGPWAERRRSVLDFGCGIGRFAQRIVAAGASYCGVDASAAMIDSARQLHPGGAVTFLHAPGLPLPLADGRFDGCLTVGVLQCLKTSDGAPLRAAVAELARVLLPGGELLIIEQASASGRFSGSVTDSSTEQDYEDALGACFQVADLRRIRCGSLSRLSAWYLRGGSMLPVRRRIEGYLARHEATIASRSDAAALRAQVYYDVAIRAVKRAGV